MCDACERQPCAIQLKADATALLNDLDELAREYDGYEYGLPLGVEGAPEEQMRAAVYKFLSKYRPDVDTSGE